MICTVRQQTSANHQEFDGQACKIHRLEKKFPSFLFRASEMMEIWTQSGGGTMDKSRKKRRVNDMARL